MNRIFAAITCLAVLVGTVDAFSQCTGAQSATVNPAPNGTCVPGTVYTFCYTMVGYNQLGANWIDGFEINLTGPWVPGSVVGTSPPANCNGGGGQWMWSNNVVGSSTGQSNGPGYFFDLNIDGNPGNDYGDNGPGCTWSFCFQVTVGNSPGANLSVGVTALSDGEIGSWNSSACHGTVYNMFNCTISTSCGSLTSTVNQNETCPGNANGQATATMTGTGPFTYSWNTVPVQNTAVATGLSAGNYTVTGTGPNNCVLTSSVNITTGTQSNAAINNINPTNTLCANAAPVQLTTVQSGGTFSGIGVSPSGLFNPANANIGANTVTYSIGGPCPNSQTITINVMQNANATINPINPSNQICTGSNPVQLTAGTAGGVWSGNGVNASGLFNPMTAGVGVHTITYSIPGPCGDTRTYNITVSDLTGTVSSTMANCTTNNGTATATPTSGTAPYTYSWNSSPAQNTATATGLASGTYDVIIQDGQGCALTLQANVGLNSGNLTVSTSTTPSTCTANNGSATATALGGTAPLSYSWNTVPVQTTASLNGLAPGAYTVTVQDAVGCLATSTANVTLNASNLTATTSSTAAICTSLNGTATINPSGGTAPFTYSWNTSPSQSTQTITGLATGNYQGTVLDVNGCTVSMPVTVSLNAGNLTATTTSTDAFCTSQNGTAAVVAVGGTAPFTYSWNTNPVQTTSNLSGLAAGNYNATVQDVNGCTATATAIVNLNPGNLTSTTTSTNAFCTSPNGTATITPSGGTAPFTYNWNSSPTQSTATATGLSAGNYNGTVQDANGCTSSTPVTVLFNPGNLTVSITNTSNVSCNGNCDGAATAMANGGTAPFQYVWDDPTFQQTPQAIGLCPNTYNVGVADANGCLATAQTVITEPSVLVASAVMNQQSNCGNPDGQASASATGGTIAGAYTYNWNSTPTQSAATATGLPPANYIVTITDDNGCTSTATVAVTATPAFTASIINVSDATCFQLCNGGATVQFSAGAVLPVSYAWNTTPALNTATVSTLCAGTHQVTITDNVGCLSTANVTINQPAVLTTTLNASSSPICIGQSSNLTAIVSGGNAPYSNYQWTAAPLDPSLVAGQQNPTVTPLISTSYNFIATDANGCTSIPKLVTVQVNQPLNLNITRPLFAPDTGICPYDFAILNLLATGGDGNYTYFLAPDNVNPVVVPMQVQPTATTTYNFSVIDGCTTPPAFASSTVQVFQVPVADFMGDVLSGCHEHTTQFTDLTVPTPASWSWSFGDPASFGVANLNSTATHQFSAPGIYSVQLSVRSAEGCVDDTLKQGYIEVFPLPIANFEASPERTNIMQGEVDFKDLSWGDITQWNWDFGTGVTSVLQNPSHVYRDTGTYYVRLSVLTADGCSDDIHRKLIIDPDFMFYVPNAFSPNRDGRNDYFRGYGEGVNWDTYELSVFNRWGEEIFYTADIDNPWRGWFKDREAEAGVYVWKIRLFSTAGIEHTYRGSVTLLR